MSLSKQEREAVARDIEAGTKQVIAQLKAYQRAMHIAVSQLHPAATSTRMFLTAVNTLAETRAHFEKAVDFGIKVKD